MLYLIVSILIFLTWVCSLNLEVSNFETELLSIQDAIEWIILSFFVHL